MESVPTRKEYGENPSLHCLTHITASTMAPKAHQQSPANQLLGQIHYTPEIACPQSHRFIELQMDSYFITLVVALTSHYHPLTSK